MSFISIHRGGGYESEESHKPSIVNSRPRYQGHVPGGKFDPTAQYAHFQDAELRKIYGAEWASMDAYTRHKKLVNDYIKYYGGKSENFGNQSNKYVLTDHDVLAQNHRFVRSAEDNDGSTWERRMAKKIL